MGGSRTSVLRQGPAVGLDLNRLDDAVRYSCFTKGVLAARRTAEGQLRARDTYLVVSLAENKKASIACAY